MDVRLSEWGGLGRDPREVMWWGWGATWKGGRQGWDTPQEDLEVDLSQAALRQTEGK